jgi:hypothetical protein
MTDAEVARWVPVPIPALKGDFRPADTAYVAQILSDLYYFTRRVQEEMARARRSGTRFSIAVFTAQPASDELPEMACVRGLPAVLTGIRETDTVCRIGLDTIVVLLVDANGDGSRRASLRLLQRLGGDAARWHVRVLEYPEQESILLDLGLSAA